MSERVAVITGGYTSRDVFSCLKTVPHSITQGDVDKDLDFIMAQASPCADYTTEHIHNLFCAGYPCHRLRRAVALWKEFAVRHNDG